MKDKSYRYLGPNSAVTLVVKDGDGADVERDVMLWQGREVSLPEKDPYTQQLLAQLLLDPAPITSAPTPAPAVPALATPAASAKKAAAVAPTQTTA